MAPLPHPNKGLNPVLEIESIGTTVTLGATQLHLSSANAAVDGPEYRDTLSPPLSSGGSGSTSASESTSTSTVDFEVPDDIDEGEHFKVQLPKPFYPPSIAQADKNLEIKPRALPAALCLPSVPQEKVISVIDPKDKCVTFSDCMMQTS
jgi:hypothetical protein